jgi:hypothetical protein
MILNNSIITSFFIFQLDDSDFLAYSSEHNKFSDYLLQSNPAVNNIIRPPSRCKPCYRPDINGRCRKIVGCEA